jgi:transposase
MALKFKPENKEQLYLLPPSINEFVSERHLVRLIESIVNEIDCSTIEEKYSEAGQKSYSPTLMLKLWIYSYCIGIYSGRKIAAKCETDTAYMFLACRYQPDFRTINDFRKDNINYFNDLFVTVLEVCRELGMATVGTIAVDGTKIRANASVSRSKDKEGYEKWKANIEKTIESLHAKADEIQTEENKIFGKKRGDELEKKIASKTTLKHKIEKILRKYEEEKIDAKKKINLTDEDAKLIKSKGRIETNYNCQGGASMDGVLAGQYVTTSASDKEELLPMVEQIEINTLEKPINVLADSGYASYDSYEKIEQQNIVAYMPDQEYENSKKSANNIDIYHRSNFKYNKEKDCYTCPQGKALNFSRIDIDEKAKQKSTVYTCKDCTKCEFKEQCTKGKYRSIYKEHREHLRQQARDRLDTTQGKEIYQKRMHTIEPIWGDIKFNRNFKMFSLRGKEKVTGEFSLVSSANNILKIYNTFIKKMSA